MIQLKSLYKKFGPRMAVDNLTLRVPAGEIYDRALVEKDRNYLDKPAGPKAKKNPRAAAGAGGS